MASSLVKIGCLFAISVHLRISTKTEYLKEKTAIIKQYIRQIKMHF